MEPALATVEARISELERLVAGSAAPAPGFAAALDGSGVGTTGHGSLDAAATTTSFAAAPGAPGRTEGGGAVSSETLARVTLGRMLAGMTGTFSLASPGVTGVGAPAGAQFDASLPDVRGVKLVEPVPGAASETDFGMRIHPVTGAHAHHDGIDIGLPTGTPIRSAAPGRVTFAGDKGGYGNLVIVDHGNGVTTRYAHQSEIHVRVGDRLVQGQVLGEVGSTGRSTGPHLHFELRVDGEARDPHGLLAGPRPGGTS